MKLLYKGVEGGQGRKREEVNLIETSIKMLIKNFNKKQQKLRTNRMEHSKHPGDVKKQKPHPLLVGTHKGAAMVGEFTVPPKSGA